MAHNTQTIPEPPAIQRARVDLAKIHLRRAIERYMEFKARPSDLDDRSTHFDEYREARGCAQSLALSVREACHHLGMAEGEVKI